MKANMIVVYIQQYDQSCLDLQKTNQQVQPKSFHTSADLYDQIQLSPSTGQTELQLET